jgi:hypothetical protein
MAPLLPYALARTLMSEFLPLGDLPAVGTTRRRTMRVGARLEQQAVAIHPLAPRPKPRQSRSPSTAVMCDRFAGIGFVRSVLAQVSNDDGKQLVFSSMPAEADRQREQLRGVLRGLGATPVTPVTILSDGADRPRSLGEAARLLSELETYVCGQAEIIIDYATARRREEPISTAVTESTVQWLLHRRMNAPADALDAARRAIDAQGPMRGDEWYDRTRSHRRRT